ncbi:MAG TPA: hypothetical protein VGL00_12780 [Terracidiphilus sp.]
MDNIFNAGEVVPYSGLYRITHYPPHSGEEVLTLTKGNAFPQCVHCSKVSFMLVNHMQESDLVAYSDKF